MSQSSNGWSKPLRFLLAVGIFALVGPPVGGMVAWLTMGARTLRSPLPFVTDSYAEGVLYAIGVGIVVAAAALWLERRSWLVAIVAVVVVHAAMLAPLVATTPPGAEVLASTLRVSTVFLPPALAAAIVCWLLTRPMLAARDPA
jgi:hypothetical protein